MYTVKQAAVLTGVTESTLRAWERRYAVVTPLRSPGGYRLYDEVQLDRLRAMSALVQAGVPASRAAETVLTGDGHERGLGEVVRVDGPPAEGDLLTAAQSLDPVRMEALLDQRFSEGPVERVTDDWLLPELHRIGEAWCRGEFTIPQEHFMSAAVMRVLHYHLGLAIREQTASGAGTGGDTAPTVLLGLPPGAWHEHSLLTFAVCLQRRGLRVVYLGADVPEAEWVRVVAEVLPRSVVLAAVRTEDVAATQAVVDLLLPLVPPVQIAVGGSARTGVRNALLLPDSLTEASRVLDTSVRAGISHEPRHAPTPS